MNLTEDEAKQRWCPFAQVGFGTRLPGVINRLQITDQDSSGQTVESGKVVIPAGAKCLGSACMAWREVDPGSLPEKWNVTRRGETTPTEYTWDPTDVIGYEDAVIVKQARGRAAGRCGLAG